MTPTLMPRKLVDPAHPLGVAAGEVIVHGDDVHAFSGERIQVHGERRDERLAFAGPHLGDRALVQDHAADELDVEMPLAERPLRGLADRREGRHEDVVDGLAGREFGPEGLGARRELGIRELSTSGSSALIASILGA